MIERRSKARQIVEDPKLTLLYRAIAVIGSVSVMAICTIGVQWMTSISTTVYNSALIGERVVERLEQLERRVNRIEDRFLTVDDAARMQSDIDRLSRYMEGLRP